MNGKDVFNAPATKGDLAGIRELIERVETSLLTEFHKWASTYEIAVPEERVSRLQRERRQ